MLDLVRATGGKYTRNRGIYGQEQPVAILFYKWELCLNLTIATHAEFSTVYVVWNAAMQMCSVLWTV